MGIRCADHVTPLYPQKLALTSPTSGGRSVGIVRSRTKATEFSFSHTQLCGYCLGNMFRLLNSHHQAKIEHSLGTQKVGTVWDPIAV
jgi:hypothetical protein